MIKYSSVIYLMGVGITSTWDFGDGSQSVQINPSHSFTVNGLFDISLLVTDSFNCTNNMVLVNHIEVLKPTANFITAGLVQIARL